MDRISPRGTPIGRRSGHPCHGCLRSWTRPADVVATWLRNARGVAADEEHPWVADLDETTRAINAAASCSESAAPLKSDSALLSLSPCVMSRSCGSRKDSPTRLLFRRPQARGSCMRRRSSPWPNVAHSRLMCGQMHSRTLERALCGLTSATDGSQLGSHSSSRRSSSSDCWAIASRTIACRHSPDPRSSTAADRAHRLGGRQNESKSPMSPRQSRWVGACRLR
jgi:hypothetical protein